MARYLVLQAHEDGSVEPLLHRVVRLAAPLQSLDPAEVRAQLSALQEERRGAQRPVVVTLLSSDPGTGAEGDGAQSSAVRFQQVTTLDPWLRAEFPREVPGDDAPHGHDTPSLSPTWLPRQDAVFVLRLPHQPGTRLSLAGTVEAELDLDVLEAEADRLPLAQLAADLGDPAVTTTHRAGPPANRVDLLVMGDGYTAAAGFQADATNLIADFFDVSPYDAYRSFVNTLTLYTPSNQAGADHPPFDPACASSDPSCCAAPEAQSDPLAGTFVDTAFDGRFCAFNIFRLAVADTAKVFAAAAAVPDWDHIVLMLNDPTYGGSGGTVAVASIHPLAVDIMRHEYGHSFTGLADEYQIPNPGFPACSDVSAASPACEANVTDETVRALIKWLPWIDPGTPVPTPQGDPTYAAAVGLFEGARYLTSGMFRPRDTDCLMNVLGVPFGEVCAQAYVLRLFDGGWGTPASGIDPIEPGLEIPAPGTLSAPGPVHFTAALLQPDFGPMPTVAWRVDGVLQTSRVQVQPGHTSFHFYPPATGTYQITLDVDAATPFVNPQMAGTSLESSRLWSATTSAPQIFADGFESGDLSAW